MATVVVLVILPALAPLLGGSGDGGLADPLAARLGLGLFGVIALTVVKVAVFAGLMLVVGSRAVPWLLHYVANTGSRELFRLAVLAIALGVAFGAARLFGVSFALGAFFAGMVLSRSALSQRAAEETLPLRDAFAVLFFVSVGILFDPMSIVRAPWPMAATLLIIVAGKSIAAFLIVLAFGRPVATALTISASLAQVGEFSFILAELGGKLNLLPPQGRDLILGGAILSILFNPLVFAIADRIGRRETGRGPAPLPAGSVSPEEPPPAVATALTGHIILAGYGRVGRIIGTALRERGEAFAVVEISDGLVAELRKAGIDAIAGNAARPDVLTTANLAQARCVFVAIPDAFEAGQVVREARAKSPSCRIIARAHSDAVVEHLAGLGADTIIMGEREIARGMIEDFTGRAAQAKP